LVVVTMFEEEAYPDEEEDEEEEKGHLPAVASIPRFIIPPRENGHLEIAPVLIVMIK
jgi:hypothetical protein